MREEEKKWQISQFQTRQERQKELVVVYRGVSWRSIPRETSLKQLCAWLKEVERHRDSCWFLLLPGLHHCSVHQRSWSWLENRWLPFQIFPLARSSRTESVQSRRQCCCRSSQIITLVIHTCHLLFSISHCGPHSCFCAEVSTCSNECSNQDVAIQYYRT